MNKDHTAFEAALAPLAALADAYDNDELDEARPKWVTNGGSEFNLDVELYSGRGGKTAITLRQAMQARFILTGRPYTLPDSKDVDEARRIFNELYIGGPTWQNLSDETKLRYIGKVKALRR